MTVAPENTYAIAVEGLVRHFGAVKAVNGVDLKVQKGEIFGFLGPNGAGRLRLSGSSSPFSLPRRDG